MQNLATASAAEILANLRSGALSAEALMAFTLDQIDQKNPSVNAIVGMRDRDDLMTEARAADANPGAGSLAGLPIAVKDLSNVAQVVSTQGSPILADFVPDQDDLLPARLRAAGAILIGKTNTPEFGLGSHTFNPVYGATRNPFDLSVTCGGSSGGAAVALSTGMVALADGSDMMGSLRNPAGWNNVYGFRPGFGVVPGEPKGDTFLHQLATLGPMARSPEDIGILLDVLAGPDPRQPHGTPWTAQSPVSPLPLSGARIAWLGDWGGAFPMEDGILELCEQALVVFSGLGAQIDTPEPPFDAEAMFQSWKTLRSWQLAPGLGQVAALGGALKETAIWEMERGLTMGAIEVHEASVVRSEWFKNAAQFLDKYDAFALPTAQVWPFDIDTEYPKRIAGRDMDTYHRWMHIAVPAALIGLPALAVPAGFGSAGLPMGMQIIGPRGSDVRLLGIGASYHAETRWPQTHPPQL